MKDGVNRGLKKRGKRGANDDIERTMRVGESFTPFFQIGIQMESTFW